MNKKKYPWEKDIVSVSKTGTGDYGTGGTPSNAKPNYTPYTPTTTPTTPTTPTTGTPEFKFSKQDQYDAAMDTYLNAPFKYDEFKYNLEADPFYQQLSNRYQKQAQLGMEDAIGRAAALTGGYGNSYAMSLGQQAYYDKMDELNDVAIGLYQNAYNMYRDKRNDAYTNWKDTKTDAYNKLGILGAEKQDEYTQYLIDNGIVDDDGNLDATEILAEWNKIGALVNNVYNEAGGGDEGMNAVTDKLYDLGYTEEDILNFMLLFDNK